MKIISKVRLVLLVCLVCMFSACEKAVFDENEKSQSSQQDKNANLIIRVKGNQVDDTFADTRAMVDITTYSTRFNFVLYQDGEKVKAVTQKKEDAKEEFGQVALTLDPGTYKLLVLAHSSVGGNPSLADPTKIQFTNADGYSDTFYYYGDIEVTKEAQTHDITLTRAVTRVFFVINDELPADVAYIKYYYTGGSGVLDATTGYGGNVNSRQERIVGVANATPPIRASLYTFLQEDEGYMDITVTALKEDQKTVVLERSFTDIPIAYGYETILEGDFFDHSSENAFSFMADTEWPTLQHVEY